MRTLRRFWQAAICRSILVEKDEKRERERNKRRRKGGREGGREGSLKVLESEEDGEVEAWWLWRPARGKGNTL